MKVAVISVEVTIVRLGVIAKISMIDRLVEPVRRLLDPHSIVVMDQVVVDAICHHDGHPAVSSRLNG